MFRPLASIVSYPVLRASLVFFFQAEDGIRDLVRSRGLGDVYKRQRLGRGADQRLQVVVADTRGEGVGRNPVRPLGKDGHAVDDLSLIHI